MEKDTNLNSPNTDKDVELKIQQKNDYHFVLGNLSLVKDKLLERGDYESLGRLEASLLRLCNSPFNPYSYLNRFNDEK